MKGTRHREERIIAILKQGEAARLLRSRGRGGRERRTFSWRPDRRISRRPVRKLFQRIHASEKCN